MKGSIGDEGEGNREGKGREILIRSGHLKSLKSYKETLRFLNGCFLLM